MNESPNLPAHYIQNSKIENIKNTNKKDKKKFNILIIKHIIRICY